MTDTPIFNRLVAERPLPVFEDSDLPLVDSDGERRVAGHRSAPLPSIPGSVAPVAASDSPQISAATGAKPFWRGKKAGRR